MALSNSLKSQFAKIMSASDVDTQKKKTRTGTAVEYEGRIYVQLDGSDQLTPLADRIAGVKDGDRVTIEIENHSASLTGNLSDPSAGSTTVDGIKNQVEQFNVIIANKADIDQLNAAQAKIDELEANDVTITGKLDAVEANITDLQAENVEITGKLDAAVAEIEDLDATYATIDFANIGDAAIENFFSKSGMIKDLVVSSGTVTGELVGVTIKGDLIEGGTVIADKLVILGDDGLYYKLNTNGETVTSEQTEYNSLSGTIITAKSITAEKIAVDDLVAFGATIGGFHITDSSLYSGVKSDINNTTPGVYMDDESQFALGDLNNYLRFFKDTDGTYKLEISAQSVKISTSDKTIEDSLDDMQNQIDGMDSTVTTIQVDVDNITSSVTDLEGNYTQLTQTVDGISSTVSDVEGNVSSLTQTVNGISGTVGDLEGNYSQLTQTVNGFEVSINNANSTANSAQSAANSALSTANALSGRATQTYGFGGSSSAVWVMLGTLNTSSSDTVDITVFAGIGYNGLYSQNSKLYITVRDGNHNATDASNRYGVTVTREGNESTEVQVRSSQYGTAQVWVHFTGAYANGSYSISKTSNVTWTHSGTLQSGAPTSGTAQSLGYLTNAASAAKVATNYLRFDSTGLCVGNYAGTLQGNVKIDSDGLDIYNGTTLLAYMNANTIALGENSTASEIRFSAGAGSLGYDSGRAYLRANGGKNLSVIGNNLHVRGDLATTIGNSTSVASVSINSGNIYMSKVGNGQQTYAPVYRLNNPYQSNVKMWTANVTERNSLINAGWTSEGVGWYAFA